VRTVAVDAGTVGTTQFNLSQAEQQMLLQNGRDAAKRFLDRFDLAGYENTFHRRFGDTDATSADESQAAKTDAPAPLAATVAPVPVVAVAAAGDPATTSGARTES
jgi:hypothetical protein